MVEEMGLHKYSTDRVSNKSGNISISRLVRELLIYARKYKMHC